MIVLSYYPSYKLSNHDTSVAIAKDGELIYAFEEQKLSRVNTREAKYLPDRTLLSALYTSGIDPQAIDVICVVGPKEIFDPQEVMKRLEKYFGIAVHKTMACPHHVAHTALSTYGSPFEDSVFWTLDAGGEDKNFGEFGVYKEGKLHRLAVADYPSIATFYQIMTGSCGFADFEEGKVMGLAAYGEVDKDLYDAMRKLFDFEEFGLARFKAQVNYIPPLIRWDKFSHDEFRPAKVIQYVRRGQCPELDEATRDHLPETIAATGQKIAEDLSVESLRRMSEHFSLPIERLSLSGGLFMNIVVNKAIRETFGCELFVPPGVNDMGLAAGGALWAGHQADPEAFSRGKQGGRQVSAYLGPTFDNDDIEGLVAGFPIMHRRLEQSELASTAAQAIADGKVVGWFQGRGEFGARALGARSVIADPRNPESKSRINQLLKKRDWFMPYAPAILEESAGEFVERPCHAPYMTLAFDSLEGVVDRVPSAIHVDGTIRPQIVRRDDNPVFHDLIAAFRDLTGVGMVLNTSFNRHGVPIVATPRHGVEHLLEGVVDVLFVGNHAITIEHTRKLQPTNLIPESVMQAILGIKHGVEFLKNGDTSAAAKIFERTGHHVEWRGGDDDLTLVIDGKPFDLATVSWDSIAGEMAAAIDPGNRQSGAGQA